MNGERGNQATLFIVSNFGEKKCLKRFIFKRSKLNVVPNLSFWRDRTVKSRHVCSIVARCLYLCVLFVVLIEMV